MLKWPEIEIFQSASKHKCADDHNVSFSEKIQPADDHTFEDQPPGGVEEKGTLISPIGCLEGCIVVTIHYAGCLSPACTM